MSRPSAAWASEIPATTKLDTAAKMETRKHFIAISWAGGHQQGKPNNWIRFGQWSSC
jgi:hypothetical protein